MNYRLLLLLVGLLTLATATIAFASLHHSAKSQPTLAAQSRPSLQIDDEEYAVYSALINDSLKDSDEDEKRKAPGDRLLIIEKHPSLWEGFVDDESKNFFEELKKNSSELEPETVNDLRVKSNEPSLLERKFAIDIKYALVGNEELEALFKEDVGGGWEAFHRKYPKSNGFLTLSRVGFNADKTQALVYKGWSCGGLCGGGAYILLRKKNGVWVVGQSVGPTWVS
ncbi:MAG TPA: hypothetical protein VGC66_18700 [Pyrinomonadaceae bacterium]